MLVAATVALHALAALVSISPTFYHQLLCQNPFAKKLRAQIVSTYKLCKKLLHEKAAHKILVKLTPGYLGCLGYHGCLGLRDKKSYILSSLPSFLRQRPFL
jgi:hypothetical protein